MKAVVDNDVLLKSACYGLLDTLLAPSFEPAPPGYLGAARFYLPKRCNKASLNRDRGSVVAALISWFSKAAELEPTDDEQRLAARLELHAQRSSLALDSGESQLCAIVIARRVPWLLTGDKRAIAAVEHLMEIEPDAAPLAGRLRCLEQLVRDALADGATMAVRSAICAEPSVDRALYYSFECSNPGFSEHQATAGL